MIGRPRRDGTEVIDAYQALESRLAPFTGEFDKRVARISETPDEHQQRDADVAETSTSSLSSPPSEPPSC